MTDLAALSAKLYDTGPWLGARTRRRAAERLTELASPEAVRLLAEAYAAGADDQVVAIAEARLARLTDQAAVDAVCDVPPARPAGSSSRLAATC